MKVINQSRQTEQGILCQSCCLVYGEDVTQCGWVHDKCDVCGEGVATFGYYQKDGKLYI